jgi:BirA family biotin operon repressor/biotin-[acetyl-CoA-carboxylase] ligase
MGRSFLSPANSGIYMSLLLRPSEDLGKISANDGVLVTACAAIAVSEAIAEITGKQTAIKWINDLYFENKKVCGILAEGAYNPAASGFDYIVLGVGLNVVGNFDGTELEHIATALYPVLTEKALTDVKNRLIAKIIDRFLTRYTTQLISGGRDFFEDYKKRLFIIGKDVDVLQGDTVKSATVLDLDKDFTLKIKYSDGKIASLNSGEVRLKLK